MSRTTQTLTNEANYIIPAASTENQTGFDRLTRDRREVFVRDPNQLLNEHDESCSPMIIATVRSLQNKTAYIPVAIGGTLSFLSMISGTTSGGAFNPARAFGPAVISGNCIGQWVYWIGDLLGAFLAVVVGWTLFSNKVFIPLSPSTVASPTNQSPGLYDEENAASPNDYQNGYANGYANDYPVGTPESSIEEMV